MQKLHRYCLLLACTTLTFFTGCNKLFDHIKDHPDEYNTSCKIKRLTLDGSLGIITADIVYNKWDDPVSIIPTHVNTGNPNWYFYYDNKHRLTEILKPYNNGAYESWTRFYYDNKGRISMDTTYVFGVVGNPWGNATLGPYVTEYQYDTKGRLVVSDTRYPENPQHFIRTSTYDSNGNKVTGDTYDNKLNFHRTHKLWMFLDQDYSVNNALPVVGYNDKGLPLKIKGNLRSFLNFQVQFQDTAGIAISYKCDDSVF